MTCAVKCDLDPFSWLFRNSRANQYNKKHMIFANLLLEPISPMSVFNNT